jgi:hypothetical protein
MLRRLMVPQIPPSLHDAGWRLQVSAWSCSGDASAVVAELAERAGAM